MARVSVQLTGIKWDTDGEDVDLPQSVGVVFSEAELLRDDGTRMDEEQIRDAAVDRASDNWGFCISGIESDAMSVHQS